MTNAESYLQTAIEKLNAGILRTAKEKQFIESIKHFSKKQLRGLSSAQFRWLRDIAQRED